MTKMLLQLASLILLWGSVAAHMLMSYPPSLRYVHNPHTDPGNADSSLTSPLSPSGSDFPCHGSLHLLGTAEGAPVASWAAGASYNFTISGGAPHNGGSCQASFSFDGGKTFTVVHSYVGNCPSPAGGDSSFPFRVPADAPASDAAVFAWTWFNNLGNREMYMNCAVVKVSSSSSRGASEPLPFASRPKIFEANIGNGCTTQDSANLLFLSPGPDVDVNDQHAVPATGTCETATASSGGAGGDNSGESSGSSTGGNSGATPTALAVEPTNGVAGMSAGGGGDSGPTGGTDDENSTEYIPGNFFPQGYSLGSRAVETAAVALAVAVLVDFVLLA
ncbi:hypothetical protein VTK73DRAFT_2832 [Phialemonium thermophilum]|uniref:Extracellular protein n=1 Tax=Phialemonium thermophilum TaxID=223376 RepID=A0ABR3VR94_9PEZI